MNKEIIQILIERMTMAYDEQMGERPEHTWEGEAFLYWFKDNIDKFYE